jgi:hypothetical protein
MFLIYFQMKHLLYPHSTGGAVYYPSVRPKIFFVAFFSATIDGRNLIFGHKLHIVGSVFWTHQIPTSCLPTWLVFIHIEHICGGIISEHYLVNNRIFLVKIFALLLVVLATQHK